MFSVSVTHGCGQVLISAVGPARCGEICSAVAFAAETARRSGLSQFLFDLLAVDFFGTVEDREEMGRFVASSLAHVRRVAVVLADKDNTGDGARAARAAGLDLQNFATIAEALEWLNKTPQAGE
jgi:hypothetical protein